MGLDTNSNQQKSVNELNMKYAVRGHITNVPELFKSILVHHCKVGKGTSFRNFYAGAEGVALI